MWLPHSPVIVCLSSEPLQEAGGGEGPIVLMIKLRLGGEEGHS